MLPVLQHVKSDKYVRKGFLRQSLIAPTVKKR
jgi:hypothetical protein